MSVPKFKQEVLEDGTKVVTLIKEPKPQKEEKPEAEKGDGESASK